MVDAALITLIFSSALNDWVAQVEADDGQMIETRHLTGDAALRRLMDEYPSAPWALDDPDLQLPGDWSAEIAPRLS